MRISLYLLLFIVGFSACSPKNIKNRTFSFSEFVNHITDSTAVYSLNAPILNVELFGTYLELKWEVSNEDSINLYVIEKAIDTSAFMALKKVESFGTESGAEYLEIDGDFVFNKPVKYRLKIYTPRGINYSEIVEVYQEKPVEKISIISNPNTHQQFLQFEGNTQSSGTLMLFHADGTIAQRKQVPIANGKNKVEIPLQNHAKGLYFLQFKAPSKEWNARILNIVV